MELDSFIKNNGLVQLNRIFPAVTSLCVNRISDENLLSLRQVIVLWPELEELQLEGEMNPVLRRFYDSCFCGVSEAEMSVLRRKSPDFLSKVHIVPSGPCLSNLQSECYYEIMIKIIGLLGAMITDFSHYFDFFPLLQNLDASLLM